MKKMLAWILTLMMVVCALPAMAEDVTTLTLWHSMTDEAGVMMEQFITQFNDTLGKEKNIQVVSVFQGTYADSTQKLQSILNAGNLADLPDVMQIDATGKISYYSSGVSYTVDQAVVDDPAYDLNQLNPSALSNWNYLGNQLGVPFATSATVTYYNKTLFENAGIPVPTTFSQVAAAADKLPKEDGNGQPIYVMAGLPNTPTMANWLGQMDSRLVDNENGSIGRATQLECLENGALAGFLTEWKAMYDQGALLNASAGLTDMFIAGQIAMLSTSSSQTSTLLSMIGDKFDLGIASYTKVNSDCREGGTPSGSGLFMFDKGNTAPAWELVKYLASAPVQAQFAAATGYIPSNLGAADEAVMVDLLAAQPLYEAPIGQLNATPSNMRSVTVGPAVDFYYAIQNNISDMLEYGQSVEETVEIMAEELNALLSEYNKANPQ